MEGYKKFYLENGYLILKNFLQTREIKNIVKKLNILEKKQNWSLGTSEPGIKTSLIHSLLKETFIQNFILKKKIYKQICLSLVGKDYISWNCKSNLKKRWYGSVEYFHQDFFYWKKYGLKSNKSMSCMIFLDDHSKENGGMIIFPGTQKQIYQHKNFLNINTMQKNLIPTNILEKLYKKKGCLKLNEKSGSCIFFNSKLVHGSGHNTSNKDRKTLLLQITTKSDLNKISNKVKRKNYIQRKKFEVKELKKRLLLIS